MSASTSSFSSSASSGPAPQIIKTAVEMNAWALEALRAGKSVGFVPTMGALHAGHGALIERAVNENAAAVVSIFVNPTQFGPNEDFSRYPRPFEADAKLCADAGVDCIYAPEPAEMYAPDARTWVEVGGLADHLCGLSRPGHFRGVATVVAKLLNIVRPTRAYFGKKDAQQLRIIEVLARDLNLGVEIVPCEIVREADGLAMSSRNRYLSAEERQEALVLNRTLTYFEERVAAGERDAMKLLGEMAEKIEAAHGAEIDYVAIVDANTLEDVSEIKGEILAALAVKFGTTRLIDNTRVTVG
jgi:pantoate--beta-alanine ligase